jgi:hypothetical protein
MTKPAGKLNKKIESSVASKVKSKNIKIKVKTKSKVKEKPKASATNRRTSKTKMRKTTKKFQNKELIVVDEAKGLIFENEKTLYGYFSNTIKALEDKYLKNYDFKNDFSREEIDNLDYWLEETLDDPDEIWLNAETFDDLSVYTLVKEIQNGDDVFNYVAVVYLNSEENYPTFVFLHFATVDANLTEVFREKEIIYHSKLESVQFAALEGDSLLEGDYLAIGLLESMIKLRAPTDIPTDKFKEYAEFRDDTINNPDEIWRQVSSEGNILVNFIKEANESNEKDLHYVVVTEEEPETQVHSLLFSFPTTDLSLLERYRQGENLEAEEVSTESSH